ncbi:PD-(D/E)XK nuclease family protein [Anaeromyxobacter terrae]|uniref:PD-(D/E)XK nuclease family protein n=1 Tax=Anaeromyxobacter terrae TaxID=2925406 RepID=UPI001F58E828|nr:PD-(D/E)XK nuclease family protein [Anaeromyxobacter sp. SG22]
MLGILLSPTDGGTAWRHALAPGEARAGFEPVGPLGLAKRLGRMLGLRAEPAPQPDRLAAYGRRIAAHDDGRRSYSASRAADPFGVASFLLALRDRLALAGWDGAALGGSARLADLSALEALEPALPPGLADVLAALAAAASARTSLPCPLAIALTAPRGAYAPRLRELLESLARLGAEVRDAPADAPCAAETTDLGRLQRALLAGGEAKAALAGDGTVLVLEADTPVETAELLASYARTRSLSRATCVVPAEEGALDAAFARHGLPTLGAGAPSRFRPQLQVLPLRLALAFAPRDPHRAAELLLLPGAPLPGRVRRALLGALREEPGIGGPAWRAAVDGAVASEARRACEGGGDGTAAGAALRERIDAWFGGEAFSPSEGIPAPQAARIAGEVARWAAARAAPADDDAGEEAAEAAGLFLHAAAAARALEKLLLAMGPGARLPQLALGQLHDVALGDGADLAPFAGEAGRAALCRRPADVLAGAHEVFWWGFVAGADAGAPPEPWTGPERAALAAARIVVAAPGEARALEALGWRRPFLAARERVVLARWRLEGTAPAQPHPLLDELHTRLAPGALEACVHASEHVLAAVRPAPFAARTAPLAAAAPVRPRPIWRLPAAALAPTRTLSASQLDALLACPMKWALEHRAQLRPGRAVDIPHADEPRLLGSFAHRLLQDLLLGDDRIDFDRATPEDARAAAARAFDARVETEAAPLAAPGREVEREAARTLVAGAAASLLEALRAGGWRPRAAEQPVSGRFAGLPIEGSVDLVVEREGREAVLDLKLSGAGYRRDDLRRGALQLAIYQALLRSGGGAYPPAAYFTLDDGQLLTVDGAAFPGATVVAGPDAHETLKDAEAGFLYWKGVLAQGLLPAGADRERWLGAIGAAAGGAPPESVLARKAPCQFCNFPTLCEGALGEEALP